ncbi:Xaa-His dipeptidase [Clostridium nigeriense]|uniref:Xaa-His dipeptidase n=1 Tax=Clostridium nigeriense TaxID=1805470 RepID=UPI003D33F3F8
MARKDSFEEIINSSLDKIESMIEQGCTDKEIAVELGIGYSTFRKYKTESVALKAVFATGKDKLNQEAEKAVFKKATGFYYYEEVPTKVKVESLIDGEIVVEEKVVISKVKKYSHPDVNAQKFWLQNKKKASWKNDPHKIDIDKKSLKLKEKEIDSKVII